MKTALCFSTLLLAPAFAGAEVPSLYDDIERAVARREPERLAEYRDGLRREIGALGQGSGDLRLYTLAYVNSRLGPILDGAPKEERLRLLREAEDVLRRSLRANPGDAEAQALLGSVYGAQISLSPLKALTLGPKVASAFAEAERLAPANPRVALQKGISLLFVPRPLGGGVEAAERELRRAEALFGQEPAGKPWPNWGRLDVLAWLGQVQYRKGDKEGARVFYERALAQAPDYAWVRRILLPQLGG